VINFQTVESSKTRRMKTLLLNASPKKTGTTYLHNFFELNQDKISNLVVPPIKEWYFIPRVSPFATRTSTPRQHSLGQRVEEMYEKETNPQYKEFFRRVANRPSGFQTSVSEVVDRVSYILDVYDENSVIVINDPNFLIDCYMLTHLGKGNLIEELSKCFSVKLFSVHRDFASCEISRLKMRYAIDRIDQKGKGTRIGSYMVIPSWLAKCNIQDFLVYDMEFVISRTPAFVKDLFASLGLGDLRFVITSSPENPNPSKEFDYSSIANHLKVIEQRWKHFDNPAGIHQKIKVSSTEYANALNQLYITFQE
jgi:hypothetical protein